MIGAAGVALTITVTGLEAGETHPLASVCVTVYVPLVLIVIELAVDVVDHTLLNPYELERITCPPAQNVVGPFAEITGAAGNGFTVTTVGVEGFEVQPFPSVTVTVYEPAVDTVID